MASPLELARFFNPRAIAFVGASERSTWSITAFQNLQAIGFAGALHLVNRRGGIVHGQTAATTCREIGAPVDTALLMVPAESLLETLQDVAAAGIRHAALVTAGYAELGKEGALRQNALAAAARALGISFLGPNCLGFLNVAGRTGCWTGATRTPPIAGRVAIVSQSGAVANYIAHCAHQQGVGLSLVIATGNEACLDLAAVCNFLVDDPATRVIAIFAEAIRDPDAFRAMAARALQASIALVILKMGRSAQTARAAQSHTGALVGDDRVFDAACRQMNLIRVDSIEELVTTANLLERTGVLADRGVGIVSISGGICEIAADRAHVEGIHLPALSATTRSELAAVLPAYATPDNPLDITGAAVTNTDLFEHAVNILAREPSFSLLACMFDVPTGSNNDWTLLYRESVASIGRAFSRSPIPVVLMSHSNKPVSDMSRTLIDAAFPYVPGGVDRGMRAIRNAIAWSEGVRNAVPAPAPETAPEASRASEPLPRSEREALQHLARFGVAVVPGVLAQTEQQAIDAARAFGGPVALKVASADIAHKSDVGGVVLGACGTDAVVRGFRAIQASVRSALPAARIDAIQISPMREGGIELFVGVKRDPQWGPVLAVGLGGVWIEVLEDVSLRLLPAGKEQVAGMLAELRGAKLLAGYRGAPPVDLVLLIDTIVRIAGAALALGPVLEAFEVNPLYAAANGIEALDALATYSAAPDKRT